MLLLVDVVDVDEDFLVVGRNPFVLSTTNRRTTTSSSTVDTESSLERIIIVDH
jgi:hypothetical protein